MEKPVVGKKGLAQEKYEIQSWGRALAIQEFRGDPKKVAVATDAFGHAVDYIHSMPVGWNLENTQEEFNDKCYNHVRANVSLKPYGFLPAIPIVAWLILAIISGIIQWVVQRTLDLYYPRND